MRSLIVIPARLESTRLPRKLLLSETGKPLIQHTYEQVSKAVSLFEESNCAPLPNMIDVIIAVDSKELVETCAKFTTRYYLCKYQHSNGTDRMGEVATAYQEDIGYSYDNYINVQGDEPEINPHLIVSVARSLNSGYQCVTACTDCKDSDNPNRVKVIVSNNMAIDFVRHKPFGDHKLHIGIYGYQAGALKRFIHSKKCGNEILYSLEQLRTLEAGIQIAVVYTSSHQFGIDTREDYDAFVARYKRTST